MISPAVTAISASCLTFDIAGTYDTLLARVITITNDHYSVVRYLNSELYSYYAYHASVDIPAGDYDGILFELQPYTPFTSVTMGVDNIVLYPTVCYSK